MCVCVCSRQIRSGPDGGKVPGAKRFAGTGSVGEERERRGGCKASGSERKRWQDEREEEEEGCERGRVEKGVMRVRRLEW